MTINLTDPGRVTAGPDGNICFTYYGGIEKITLYCERETQKEIVMKKSIRTKLVLSCADREFDGPCSPRTILAITAALLLWASALPVPAVQAEEAGTTTVTSWSDNRLDIFGLGTDHQMFHKAWNGSAWLPSTTGWEALGGTFSSQISSVSWSANRLDIFGLGTDHQMFHKAWNGSAWLPSTTGWEALGGTFSVP